MQDHLPRIGVNPTSIGVSIDWWTSTARLLESAGYDAVWCWDHFISRGRRTDPVLECWTTLTAAAARTNRLRLGSFVTSIVGRHPAILARATATLQEFSHGRLDVGIGIGGNAREYEAYGIDFPETPARIERLEDAVEVLRRLWTGGPVDFDGRHYRLREAHAYPVPQPAPRVVVGGASPGGARLAARIGDAWTTDAVRLAGLAPIFLEALAAAGRTRSDVAVVVAVDLRRDAATGPDPVLADLRGEAERWREQGADEVVIQWLRPSDLDAVLTAAERAGLG